MSRVQRRERNGRALSASRSRDTGLLSLTSSVEMNRHFTMAAKSGDLSIRLMRDVISGPSSLNMSHSCSRGLTRTWKNQEVHDRFFKVG